MGAGTVVATVTLAAGLAVLLRHRSAIRQTTLVSPWSWAVAATCAWSAVELIASFSGESSVGGLTPLRLAVIALSFCPAVSLIGAKRPQHAAWNFVVLSLWGIVALPAAENFFLHPGQKLAMGDARGWFLWILLLLGPINFVPTRFWLAALLIFSGQFLGLSRYLALVQRPLVPQPDLLGLALCGLGILAAAFAARRISDAASPYDRLWLDFRDSFGLFWALRVQERVNAAAQQYDWDLDLTWSGFRRRSADEPAGAIDLRIEPALRTTLKGLLRRFVSHEWIAERTGQSLD
jgi:hypothetical protein